MPLEILTIPCLQDNYAFLAHDTASGTTALIDIPEAAPILAALDAKGWSLDLILVTHHHWDHVEGLKDVLAKHPAQVIGNAADKDRLPPLDVALNDGDSLSIGAESGVMFDVSGHTIGHVAFHFPDSKAVFTADSLMAMGCGRVFEGTKPQMWDSLSKFLKLPTDTIIYSGHEYTAANAQFALSVDPDNAALHRRVAQITAARKAGKATVPSLLSDEFSTNPFLRAIDPAFATALGMQGADPVDVFTEVRNRKDTF